MAHIVGTNGNDSLVGTSGVDTIEGLGGDDTLVGLGGSDSLNGGLGNDRYVVGTGDVLSDAGGTDTIETSITWHLAAGFENLVATGTATTSHGGNNLNNHITGNAGSNWIAGREGNDTLLGGGGGDTFNMSNGAGASYGSDSIDGGTGVDTLDFGAAARTAVFVDLEAGTASGGGTGGAGNVVFVNIENVNGSAFDDSITGSAAANFLFGFDGNDSLDGGAGNDRLEGGAGNDQYVFSSAAGTAHADTIVGFASGSDKLVFTNHALGPNGNFTSGDSRFASGPGLNAGQDGDDWLVYNTTTGQLWYDADGVGSGAAQLVATLQGAPVLQASDIVVQNGSSGQVINGTEGSDFLEGTDGNDTIDGRGGPDFIHGHDGDDSLIGGLDDDFLWGEYGADTLVGGDGNDRLNGDQVGFDSGDASADLLIGGAGNDTLDGGFGGGNTLDGGLGNDTYYVWSTDDVLSDAGGIDSVITIHTSWTLGAGFENLDTTTDDQGNSRASFLAGNELNNIVDGSETFEARIEGRGGNDTLFGSADDGLSYLDGGEGNDLIHGGFGFHTMAGGAGNDTLHGSGRPDNFLFDVAPGAANADTIVGFALGDDLVVLDGEAGFGAIGPSGRFAENDPRFHAAAGATFGDDADDRVIYDTTTGNLYYDADGHFGGAAQLIAQIQGAPALIASDISVVNGQEGTAINGTAGDDSMFGTPGNDTMNGLGGNDDLMGQAGDDRLDGGTGNDFLLGESGADHLIGGEGNDSLAGEDDLPYGTNDFADTLDGGVGNDSYYIHGGDEVVLDAGGIDSASINVDWTLAPGIENAGLTGDGLTIHGNELANQFVNFPFWTDDQSLPTPSTIFAGAGNDTMAGGWPGASEIFHGEAGDDLMFASGYGRFTGGAGADTFVAGFAGPLQDAEHAPFDVNLEIMDFASGVDQMRLDASGNMSGLGTSGEFATNDARFHAAAGATGGHDADDRVVYDTSSGNLWYDADGSGAASAELIGRLAGAPTLVATDIEVVNGTAGGSTINGTANNDTLVGGAGNDTINGLAGADLLQGLGGNDSILGGTGWDTLQGGDGSDWLQGGGWSDTMTGGAGADSFVWAEAGTNNRDTVSDFVAGTDELLFENGTLAALGGAGAWSADDARFWAAAGATSGHDTDDRLVYNTTTGNLYYDADGSGAGAAQVVATFTGAPGIAATDITVI